MPRPLRIEYDGAWYHVMNRGANYQAIYYDDAHRNIFLSLLQEIKTYFFVETHAYCLMDNHYHLLLHTPIANLGRAMRHLDGLYTQRFNRIENRDGPLFRGRYKAILVDKDSYLLGLSRYIHLNPVTAKICHSPAEYVWSSYSSYVGLKNKESWLQTNEVLQLVNNNKQQYISYVNEGNSQELHDFYNQKKLSPILGEKSFVKDKLRHVNLKQIEDCSSDVNQIRNVVSPEKIICQVMCYYKIDLANLKKSKRNERNLPRMTMIHLLYQLGQLTYAAIAKYIECSVKNIAVTLQRFRKIMLKDEDVKADVKKLIDNILLE